MGKKDLRDAVHLLQNARYWYRKAGRAFSADAAGEVAALRATLER